MPMLSMVFCNVPQVKNNSRFIYCKHYNIQYVIEKKRFNVDS